MNQPEFVDAPAKAYMSEQEFIAHMDELIPTPSVETNNNLLDLANSLWWEMKDDLYHAFSFVSRHFTPETLQSVYDLCGARRAGLLPWEIIGAAIYSQTGTPPETISTDEMRAFVLLPEPETAGTVSTLAACTVRENGQETQDSAITGVGFCTHGLFPHRKKIRQFFLKRAEKFFQRLSLPPDRNFAKYPAASGTASA